jgi:hypothetical protein
MERTPEPEEIPVPSPKKQRLVICKGEVWTE